MEVVSNSSPLILYASLGRLDLLQSVFTEMVIPLAVHHEITGRGEERPGVAALRQANWITVRAVQNPATLRVLAQRVDRGEAEAIALALEMGSTTRLVIDDRRGRSVAMRLGISVYGSGGVLVMAKQRGVLAEVRPVLDDLRAAGLYLGDAIYQRLLAQAGEPTS